VRFKEPFNASTVICIPCPGPIFRDSTHAFGLSEAVELSRALNQLPSDLVIYGIEGEHFDAGTGPSRAVLSGVNDLVRCLQQEINRSLFSAPTVSE
jgi:hydrogenase maturation protease